MIVVASSSWRFGPYFVNREDLEGFFDDHVEMANDCVLTAGDAFFLSPETNTLVVHTHHDYAVALTGPDGSK